MSGNNYYLACNKPWINNPRPQSNIIREEDCMIDRMVQDEIDRGIPEHRRTRAFYISCPCPKCSPARYL